MRFSIDLYDNGQARVMRERAVTGLAQPPDILAQVSPGLNDPMVTLQPAVKEGLKDYEVKAVARGCASLAKTADQLRERLSALDAAKGEESSP